MTEHNVHHPRPLIRAERLRARCRQMGRAIARDYAGQDLLVVPLLGGAFCFVADLVREIPLPGLELHFASASSYGAGTISSGRVQLSALPDCAGRPVLVVDDILDTGRTLEAVCTALTSAGISSLRSCVLLDKPSRRIADISADYVGFTIPDRFVIGYGLDYDGRYRHLPDVCVID
ncbi:MAG: hypoxanthine phosphoribosyltransferase [Planctomycetota bacterium]|jgi:hypoxanthine phosphoribosyltransferase|nr:hypoxanthine phosphoribosyltransferase [Planctomycetota bacterium]